MDKREMIDFAHKLRENRLRLNKSPIEIAQVNIGRRCNQACHHCHVEAGPNRSENMEAATVERVLEILAQSPSVHTVDFTGGAPELNPNFRRLVEGVCGLGMKVLDRCNLTVLFEPGQEETAYFLQAFGVHVVASLPCYSAANVERQRGPGAFDKSIEGLKLLNRLGYGQDGSGLQIDLVYNPTGPFLPPCQEKLEKDYKRELSELFGIRFNRLLTITNMPIRRFLKDLRRQGMYEKYMELLLNNFNPAAAGGVMCRNLVSIAWNGELYDCDFNQMLDLPLKRGRTSLWDIQSLSELENEGITLANHCYACTAGAGSSCGGALA